MWRNTMGNNRREEIMRATLELAAQKGLGNVSMQMIADKIGIKKPSLYNHFSSKEAIVEAMYQYLREQAKEKSNVAPVDYAVLFENKTAFEILKQVVDGYKKMSQQEEMLVFYKFIYSERCSQPMAAQIMAEETKKMILATKQLFYAMEIHKILHFEDPDMSAVSFAMTVHGLLDYELDQQGSEKAEEKGINEELMQQYLKWFCKENGEEKRC